MERIALIYFEGNDSKVTIYEKEKDTLKMVKAASLSTFLPVAERQTQNNGQVNYSQIEMLNFDTISSEESSLSSSFAISLSKLFEGTDLKQTRFIPIITEPYLLYQRIDNEKELSLLKNQLKAAKKENPLEIISIADGNRLAVYPSGRASYLNFMTQLANLNSLKYLNIVSVKSADISLARYASAKHGLKDGQITLLLYVGKDYTRQIYMKGTEILHIGNSISAGRNTANSSYIIISKILLEIDSASIHNPDQIIISGEDTGGALYLSLENSFPDAAIKKLETDNIQFSSNLPPGNSGDYSVNIAAAEEYVKEQRKQIKGVNLLPAHVIENQKVFGWHSYLLMLLIFASVFGLTMLIKHNGSEAGRLDREIQQLQQIKASNRELSDKLASEKAKVEGFIKDRAILDKYNAAEGTLSAAMKKIADYTAENKEIWFTGLTLEQGGRIRLSGYALYRSILTGLSYSYKDGLLSGIIYEPLRDYKAYRFSITTSIDNAGEKNETQN